MEQIKAPETAGLLQRFYCPRHGVVLQHLDTESKERVENPPTQLDCCKCPFTCVDSNRTNDEQDH